MSQEWHFINDQVGWGAEGGREECNVLPHLVASQATRKDAFKRKWRLEKMPPLGPHKVRARSHIWVSKKWRFGYYLLTSPKVAKP